MIRGVIIGLLATLLGGCVATRSTECVADSETGRIACGEVIDVQRY